ncbi:MAG: hypothetical protein AAF183_15165 [Pseudomonadota bacterium]
MTKSGLVWGIEGWKGVYTTSKPPGQGGYGGDNGPVWDGEGEILV